MLKLKDRTAVVTGAASGIGRAIAASLARRGCHLALADIDDAALARTASELAEPGLRISRHHLDVSDRDAVAAFPARVIAEHDGVDVLVNNAASRSAAPSRRSPRAISTGCSRSIFSASCG